MTNPPTPAKKPKTYRLDPNGTVYESASAGAFMRRWGWEEAGKFLVFDAVAGDALMLNAQNIYDLLFGDIAAAIDGRFFIAEFKRDRDGFQSELKTKPLRQTMIDHMKDAKGVDCRELGDRGHFAIYPDGTDFSVETYFSAVDPVISQGAIKTFKEFFTAIHGGTLGLEESEFYRYIECALRHLFASESETPAGTFLFGHLNPKGIVTFFLANNKQELQLILLLALKKMVILQKQPGASVNNTSTP